MADLDWVPKLVSAMSEREANVIRTLAVHRMYNSRCHVTETQRAMMLVSLVILRKYELDCDGGWGYALWRHAYELATAA